VGLAGIAGAQNWNEADTFENLGEVVSGTGISGEGWENWFAVCAWDDWENSGRLENVSNTVTQ
jgi:hypothetical protein